MLTRDVTGVELVGDTRSPPLESRSRAVGAVFGGGVGALVGVGLAVAAGALTGPASLLAGLGAALVGGGGLVWMSRAARHLLRFGSPGSAVGLTAGGILGAMVGVWPVFGVLQLLGVWRAPLRLSKAYALGLLGVGLVVLVLTLRLLVRWFLAKDDTADGEVTTGY